MLMQILSWVAIGTLSVSYWFQIYKIHVHKEVRDISLTYHVLLAVGFTILGFTAFYEDSIIFLAKQILTTVPVLVIIAQIFIHRQDTWHDDDDPMCTKCGSELEQHWQFCAYCGTQRDDRI